MDRNAYYREYYARNKSRLREMRQQRIATMTSEQRQELIVSHVQIDTHGCWIWQGTVGNHGYGWAMVGGKQIRAHRAAYEAYRGPIPTGLVIDHLCRVKRCCNPEHLEAVTQRENTRRGTNFIGAFMDATHCKYGHPLSGDNVYAYKDGRRRCQLCRKRFSKESQLRRSQKNAVIR